jgi:hypothetical protein
VNYAEARQIEGGGGWHFTVRNDDRIWTHECCRDPGPPATPEDVERFGYRLGDPTLGKAHTPHATREEAEQCLHDWRVRQAQAWEESDWSNWQGCEAGVDVPELDDETKAAIDACPSQAYHSTHRYCPSCPWTEQTDGRRCDTPTKKSARYRDVGDPSYVSLCDKHRTTENVVAHVDAHRVSRVMHS